MEEKKLAEPVSKEPPVTAPPANNMDEKAEEKAIKLFTTAAETETATGEPSVSETPQMTNEEEYLKEVTKTVEEFEEFESLIHNGSPWDEDGRKLSKKEQIQRENRFVLLESLLFGPDDDYCAPGVVEKELEELRSQVMELEVMELGDEAKALLRRIDELAEKMSDE